MGNSKLSLSQKLQDTGKLTDTPETDAQIRRVQNASNLLIVEDCVLADFARSLERRLNAAVQELAKLKEAKGHDQAGLHHS